MELQNESEKSDPKVQHRAYDQGTKAETVMLMT